MSLFSKNIIKDNKNTVVTIGQENIVSVSQMLSEVQENSITDKSEEWTKIIEQISLLQKTIKELSDSFEDLRDQKLIPILSEAKSQAKDIAKNPKKEKKAFIEKFKSFCDLTGNIVDVAEKVAPYVKIIANIIGIPIS